MLWLVSVRFVLVNLNTAVTLKTVFSVGADPRCFSFCSCRSRSWKTWRCETRRCLYLKQTSALASTGPGGGATARGRGPGLLTVYCGFVIVSVWGDLFLWRFWVFLFLFFCSGLKVRRDWTVLTMWPAAAFRRRGKWVNHSVFGKRIRNYKKEFSLIWSWKIQLFVIYSYFSQNVFGCQ